MKKEPETQIMEAIKQLFTPLNYLRIKHPIKIVFDLYIPFFLTLLMFGIFFFMPEGIKFFGDKGFLESVSGILQMLTGFFIASLAAVATFESKILDEIFDGDPATLKIEIKGETINQSLSRRRFLSYLFGYLSFLSFFLYFFGVIANLMVAGFLIIIPDSYQYFSKWFFVFIYLFILSNMTITTLLGLHYMTDRIHR